MILYYSGANKSGTEQNQAEKSLGGYVSSSIVPNGMINSIFCTISKTIVEKNKRDTRLIVLTNITGSTVFNVKLWIDNTSDNCVSNIIMAAVAPAFDECNNAYFEQIQNTEALPYQATLSAHNGQENAINVGSIGAGVSIGIWLSRTVIAEDFPTINGATNGTSPEAIAALEAAIANPLVEDDSNLVIAWDAAITTTTTTHAPTTTSTTTIP